MPCLEIFGCGGDAISRRRSRELFVINADRLAGKRDAAPPDAKQKPRADLVHMDLPDVAAHAGDEVLLIAKRLHTDLVELQQRTQDLIAPGKLLEHIRTRER